MTLGNNPDPESQTLHFSQLQAHVYTDSLLFEVLLNKATSY
jgi:hypothetical protein